MGRDSLFQMTESGTHATPVDQSTTVLKMTKGSVDQILERLDRIEVDLAEIKVELAETRGAYRLAKFVIALLGVSGLGGLLAWMNGGR
jgi:hypothetical protein